MLSGRVRFVVGCRYSRVASKPCRRGPPRRHAELLAGYVNLLVTAAEPQDANRWHARRWHLRRKQATPVCLLSPRCAGHLDLVLGRISTALEQANRLVALRTRFVTFVAW